MGCLLVSDGWLESKTASLVARQQLTKFARYYSDPVGFAKDVLGLTVWGRQREILLAIAAHPNVAVRSGHKCSKSCTAIAAAIWWVATRPGKKTRAILTAPSMHQVKNILWQELDTQWDRVKADLGGEELPKDPATGVRVRSGAKIVGLSTDDPRKVAGISGDELLFIIDEASGYPDELYEAIEGNSAGGDEDGGAKVLAISNPTQPSGWFFDAFQGSTEWHCIAVSSEETPNVVEGRRVINGLATRKYIEKMRTKYGPNYREHPTYQIRVLGIFPESGDQQAISLGLVDAAAKRWTSTPPDHGLLAIGIDPAWYGSDDAVIQPVRGLYAYKPSVLSGEQDGHAIATEALRLAALYRRADLGDRCIPIVVDGISCGADTVGVLRRSEECKRGLISVVVHEGFRAAQSTREVKRGKKKVKVEVYANRRTEVWFETATWLKRGVLPPDPELRKELLSPRYVIDAYGRKMLEPKKVTRKRLKKSPNKADALTLATSVIVPTFEAGYESDDDDDYDDDDDF